MFKEKNMFADLYKEIKKSIDEKVFSAISINVKKNDKDILNLYPSEDSLKSALSYLMGIYAYNQYIDFIKYLIELGADNFNSTMTTAASLGQNNIVQLMLDLGADDLHNTLINAAINKHYNVCKDKIR